MHHLHLYFSECKSSKKTFFYFVFILVASVVDLDHNISIYIGTAWKKENIFLMLFFFLKQLFAVCTEMRLCMISICDNPRLLTAIWWWWNIVNLVFTMLEFIHLRQYVNLQIWWSLPAAKHSWEVRATQNVTLELICSADTWHEKDVGPNCCHNTR